MRETVQAVEGEELNRFLVEVFHGILKTEEAYTAEACSDLSLRELHLIEEVCLAVDQGRDNRSMAIAAAQRVTAGTLTTVASQLEKKGYLLRRRDERDKRAVRLYPTEKGREANLHHSGFHRDMVDGVLKALEPEEARVFARALRKIADFFRAE